MRLERPARERETARPRWAPAVLTAAMAVSMLQLFLIGALGPRLVEDGGFSRTVLGLTTTAGFGVAALLSLRAGRWVDRLGARRCLVALLALAAVALALIGSATGTAMLLAAVALGGLPQALANPATNKVILAVVPKERRGSVTGWKQSGVQLGAFAAGVPLAALAGWLGWRGAVFAAAGAALGLAVWSLRVLPPDPEKPAEGAAGPPPRVRVGRLALFCLLLGCGIASVNTYLALYGSQRLDLGPVVAAWLVAVLGIMGIAGRVGWSRRAGGMDVPALLLAPLAAGACGASLLLAASGPVPALVWLGAAGVGALATAGNAVSMVAVIKEGNPKTAGRASALVSAGFFGGFALGPPLFGLLVDHAGYGPGWWLVAGEFLGAALVVLPLWARR
ncbi:MFS transporter [Spirillospora sp. CA-294931]|uniref:MFS transporter n=1 Tax=Spirillospora sp. CA-294931 TaxID=3240042 RepID=UPI003D8EA46A